MEYIALNSFPHYEECEKIVKEMGYNLVELKIIPQKKSISVHAVIASENCSESIGVNDCSRVHKVLSEKLRELLRDDNIYMELSSPGTERNIKNAAEFVFFTGRQIRIWDKNISDWLCGVLVSSDLKSLVLEISQKDGLVQTKTVLFADIAKAKFISL